MSPLKRLQERTVESALELDNARDLRIAILSRNRGDLGKRKRKRKKKKKKAPTDGKEETRAVQRACVFLSV